MSHPPTTPTLADLPPPDPAQGARRPDADDAGDAADPRVPLRQRIPELVATLGALLVAAAVAGFLSSSWVLLAPTAKAMVLAATSAGLTTAALWASARAAGRLSGVVPLAWAAAAAATAGAVLLAVDPLVGSDHRMAVAVAGLAAAGHAAWLVRCRPDSAVAQLVVAAALVFAAGPFSADPGATWIGHRGESLGALFAPLLGLFDAGWTSRAYLVTAPAYAAIGAGWLALSARTTGPARRTATASASALLAVAALHLNVLPDPAGAAVALLIVLGMTVAGVASDRPGLLVAGTVGSLVAGVRVLLALFSGAVATTIVVLAAGVVMLAWAVDRLRADDEQEAGGD